MTTFEFLFSLYGLVLGLAIAEILGGFARALDSRPRVTIGWLTPLLGLLLLLDLTTYWAVAWMFRDLIPNGLTALFGALAFTSFYYLAAYRVFPRELDDTTDLNARFFEVRQFVLSLVICARVLQLLAVASVPSFATALTDPFTRGTFVLALSLPVFAMVVKSKWAAASFLAMFIFLYAGGAIFAVV